MAKTIEAVIRRRWLSPENAVREVVRFERRFGDKHLNLACHCGLLLILTPELVNLIRINFLDEENIDWIAESNFLLSSLCRPLQEGVYEVEPCVREVLLVELEKKFGWKRPFELAEFLWFYLEKKSDKKQSGELRKVQRWIAQAYLDPDRTIWEMEKLLSESLPEDNPVLGLAGQEKLPYLVEILAQPLEQTNLWKEYQNLVLNSHILAKLLVDEKEGLREEIEELKEELGFVLTHPVIKKLLAEFPSEYENNFVTIDLLIITALKDELDALKNCDNQFGNTWQELTDNLGYPYYKTTLSHKNGTTLNIVAARPVEMGEINTCILATRLISELKPRYLAMNGVCAGNKKDVFLGDVIVAKRVFKFDHDKFVAYDKLIDNQQIRTEEIFHNIRTYNLKLQWEFAIQEFPQDWLNTIQTPRPKSYYHQERWLLHKLYNYQEQPNEYSRPEQDSERQTECPDWRIVIQRLREEELLKTDSLELTEKAVKEVKNERLEYLESLENQHYKEPLNPQIHLGAIATTSKVQKDPQLFQRIEKLQRKILGVEMESVAIGAVAEIQEIPMIIVKGVQDYSDNDKNDQFREYAAEVSARFLFAFFTTITLTDDQTIYSTEAIIFSILREHDLTELESIFQKLFQQFLSIYGRQAFLQSVGINDYFINSLNFNLSSQEFTTVLVSKLKDYRVSRQNPYYHPLLLIIHYITNQPREKFYSLDDRDIEFLEVLQKMGNLQIKKFLQNQTPETIQSNNQRLNNYLSKIDKNLRNQGAVDIQNNVQSKDGKYEFERVAKITNFELPFALLPMNMRGDAFFIIDYFSSINIHSLRQYSTQCLEYGKDQTTTSVGSQIQNFRIPSNICFSVAVVDNLDQENKRKIRQENPFAHNVDILWYEVPVVYCLSEEQLYFYDKPSSFWEQFQGEGAWKNLRKVIETTLIA
ncbi:MAG: 5'-methylthioadenosine/S-adenosylhomocysteine nucleosidase [Okeania sp. SIO2C2]|uniref:phosphorylase family protein n=1 Tax=Okeania sp. SIO2C2 TaxID=2607787 RepID=UPI0013B9F019|nr:hypothetical protein [Okeania sp. SIO2C2]NEP89247.1 5'-methylthioadenosine/S-adenosylhomocysteine nucleosidase [Okeania sp. SIO2C2]